MKNRKRLFLAIMILVLMFTSACSKAPDSGVNWDESFGIVVHRDGDDKITVILSPSRSEGITQEALNKEKEEYGYYSATLNSDGSVTRVVNEDYYERLIGATGDVTKSYALALVMSGQFPKMKYAAYTEDFKASVLFTESEEPDKNEILAMYFMMEQAKSYLAITGQDPNQDMQSYIVNHETGKHLYGITEEKNPEIEEIIQAYINSEKTESENTTNPVE